MKLYALDCGSMYVDESSLVAGSHNASFRNQNPRAEWVRIPVCAYVIETVAGLILYDTGCHERESEIAPGSDTPSPYVFEPVQLLPERLRTLGVSPCDVKCVVISHLHCDHAGYLHLFTGADIVAADTEFTQAMRLYGLRGFGAGPYIAANFNEFLRAGLNWRLMRSGEIEYEICPGLTAVNFGSGHAFGMTGLLVELEKSGNFLLCSDALYRSDNLGPPVRLPGLVYDSLGYSATAGFIVNYAKRHGAKIVFGHDAAQFNEILNSGGVFE